MGREPQSGELAAEPVARTIRNYELIERLGAGGMGTVYKALHSRLKRVVALKILPQDRLQDPHAVARFQREMEAVGQLEHPNIVQARDAGEDEGVHYLVMEYVDGLDLAAIARRLGPLPVAESCETIRQAAVGLESAHQRGMVHRDIKPGNLMLAGMRNAEFGMRNEAVVKVLDLGLALLQRPQAGERELTTAGQMMGTVDYMAPEQGGDSHEVDIRADVYSLGATLYKLLSGQSPLGDKPRTIVQKLSALANQPATPVGELRQDIPEEVAAVVDRCLSKEPEDRFASPAELAAALAPFCEGADLAGLLDRAEKVESESCGMATQLTSDHVGGQSSETPATGSRGQEAGARDQETGARGQEAGARDQETGASAAAVGSAPTIAPNTPTRTAPRVQPSTQSTGRRLSRNARRALATAAGLFILFCGVMVFRVMTDKGEVVISSYDPDVEIVVKRNGQKVEEFQLSQRGKAMTLYSGEYEIQIKGAENDAVHIANNRFTLTRGERELVKITRLWPEEPPEATADEADEDTAPRVLADDSERPKASHGLVKEIRGPWERGIHAVAAAPDSRTAAVGGFGGRIYLISVPEGEIQKTLPRHSVRVDGLAYLPDGRLLSAGNDRQGRSARLWDPHDGQFEQRRFEASDLLEGEFLFNDLAVSSDGRFGAAVGSHGLDESALAVWDLASGERILAEELPVRLMRVAFSPDSTRVAVAGDQRIEGKTRETLQLWNLESAKLVREVLLGDSLLQALAFLPDGRRVLVADTTSDIRVVDLAHGEVEGAMVNWPHGHRDAAILAGADYALLAHGIPGPHFSQNAGVGQLALFDLRQRWVAGTTDSRGNPHRLHVGLAPQDHRRFAVTPDERFCISGAFIPGPRHGVGAVCIWRLPDLSEPEAQASDPPDVRLARHILGHGGMLRVKTTAGHRAVRIASEIPEAPFDIVEVRFGWRNLRATDEALRSLAGIESLQVLNLPRTGVTDKGLPDVGRMRNLRLLQLDGQEQVTDDGLRHLARLKNLEALSLRGTGVTGAGLQKLKALTNLRVLHVADAEVDGAGLAALKQMPNLSHVGVSADQLTAEGLAALDGMENLRFLEVRGDITDEIVQGLSQLTGLDVLELAGAKIDEERLQRLCDALPGCPILTSRDNIIQEELARWAVRAGAEAVVHYEIGYLARYDDPRDEPLHVYAIESLDFTGAPRMDDEALRLLAALSYLRELSLANTPITDAGMEHLLAIAEGSPRLEKLDLRGTGVTDESVIELREALPEAEILVDEADRRRAAARWILNVGGSLTVEVGENGQQRDVTAGDELPEGPVRIVFVDLERNTKVDDDSLAHLAGLESLEMLNLAYTKIGDAGVRRLVALPSLGYLNLVGTVVTDTSLGHIAEKLPSVIQLHLSRTSIGDAGLAQLAPLNLRELSLDHTQIGDAGLRHLHGMKNLVRLSLADTRATSEGVAALQRALADCEIERVDSQGRNLFDRLQQADIAEHDLRWIAATLGLKPDATVPEKLAGFFGDTRLNHGTG